MKPILILIPLCLALAACETTGSTQQIKTVTVQVPVQVPCRIPYVSRPEYALQRLGQGADYYDRVKAAFIEIEQRKGYEARLEAAAKACDW